MNTVTMTGTIKTGSIWESKKTGRQFRAINVTQSFVEFDGVNAVATAPDMNQYGGWKTIFSVLEKYELIKN